MAYTSEMDDVAPVGQARLEELIGIFRDGRPVVALVGAGLSVPAGLPQWRKLIEEAHGPRVKTVLSEESWKDLAWRAEVALGFASDDAAERQRAPARKAALLRQFRVEDSPELRSRLVSAKRVLEVPFKHILTTNYDNVLDTLARAPSRVVRWDVPEERARFLQESVRPACERYFVHLHGRYDRPEGCILTDSDYVDRYIRDPGTLRNLYSLFSRFHVVFVGYSLGDVEIQAILREVTALNGEGCPTHFAFFDLTGKDDDDRAKRFEQKFGVRVISYDPADGHAQLGEKLATLGARVAERAARPSTWWKVGAPKRRPDDPAWGRYGAADSSAEGNRAVGPYSISVSIVKKHSSYLQLEVVVERTDGEPLTEEVVFELHPTFPDPLRHVEPKRGKATLPLSAWGAFTIGAVVNDPKGPVLLELRMTSKDKFPKWFLDR